MKYKITIFLAFLISNFSFGQQKDCDCNYITDYYQLVYKAQYNYLKENYDSAYIYLKQAEKNCPLLDLGMVGEPEMLAEISARKSLYEDTSNYLKMKIQNGKHLKYFVSDSVYSEFWKSTPGKELKKNSQKIYDEWYSNLNLELRAELVWINEEDQRVRRRSGEDYDWDEIKRVDSINIKRLKEILTEYGYPSQKLVGLWHLDNERADIYTLIMHIHEEEDLKFFKPLFLEYVKCGKSSYPGIYANLIDSNDRGRGIFTYGVYSNIDDDLIEDFENLDERRISVGLPPLKMNNEIHKLLEKKFGF